MVTKREFYAHNTYARIRWTVTALSLVVLGIILMLQTTDQRTFRRNSEEQRLLNLLNAFHDNLVRDLVTIDNALDTLQGDLPTWLSEEDGQNRAMRRMRSIRNTINGVSSVLIIEDTGQVWSADTDEHIGTQVKPYELPSTGTHTAKQLYVVAPEKTGQGEWILTLVKRVSVPARSFSAQAIIRLTPDAFQYLARSVLFSGDTRAAIVHSGGMMFLNAGLQDVSSGISLACPDSVLNVHLRSGRNVSILHAETVQNKEKRLLVIRTLVHPHLDINPPLVVSISRSSKAIYEIVDQARLMYLMLYVLIILILVCGLLILDRREIEIESEKARIRMDLERMALHDPLTGLCNRRMLTDNLQQYLARNKRTGSLLAVLFIDLDGFKVVNDTLGHDTGDALLKALAERMKALLRASDTLARLGGDEFIAVIHDVTNRESCKQTAKRLLEAASTPFLINGTSVRISASIGIRLSSTGEVPVEMLIQEADQAMYHAKQAGKNRMHFFKELHNDA